MKKLTNKGRVRVIRCLYPVFSDILLRREGDYQLIYYNNEDDEGYLGYPFLMLCGKTGQYYWENESERYNLDELETAQFDNLIIDFLREINTTLEINLEDNND